MEETKSQTTTRGKKSFNIIYYIIAVVCTTAFFVHEFVPKNSDAFNEALANYKQAKSKRTTALNKLKKSQEGTTLYNEYHSEKENTDKLFDEFNRVEKQEHFLLFDNFKQFLGEFGWAIGLFIYAFFNVVISYIRKSQTIKGEIALHSSLIFISLYFVSWCIQTSVMDYPKLSYILYSLFTTALILYATNILVNHKKKYISSLMTNIRDLIGFMFKNTKPESEDKMWEVLNKVEHERD